MIWYIKLSYIDNAFIDISFIDINIIDWHADSMPGDPSALASAASLPCFLLRFSQNRNGGRVYTIKTERLCQYAPSHYVSLSTQKITQIIINFRPSQHRQISMHIHT